MILSYTLDELRDLGGNLLHRLDSNYLYEGSDHKGWLDGFINVGLDELWSKYLNETQQAGDSGEASHLIFNIFEYVIIALYKIDEDSELMRLSQLTSEKLGQVMDEFNNLKQQAA